MGDEENELFCEQFSIYPGKAKFKVTLTGKRVLVNQADSSGRERSEDIILLDDVTGCYVLEDKRKNSLAAYLSIYSYPLKKKKFGSSVVRQRIERTFTIECKKTYQENSMLAEKWKMTIKRLVAGEKIRTVEDIENGALAVRNLLVLINPFSGRKRAETLYKEKVKPMFIEAEIKHTVKKTEYPGHAREMAKLVKLEDWDGIVIVSGDGLVHEVINGLMDRPDWKEAIKMPIGIVPGGSGNALAAALVYASTGADQFIKDTFNKMNDNFTLSGFALNTSGDKPKATAPEPNRPTSIFSLRCHTQGNLIYLTSVGRCFCGLHSVACPVMCIFEICRGAVSKMDLLAIETQDSHGYSNPAVFGDAPKPRHIEYSFMSIILGLIADIDIESESLRCLGGELRILVYAIIRILFLRKYNVEISYLPCVDVQTQNSNALKGDKGSTLHAEDGAGDIGDPPQNTRALLDIPNLDDALPDSWVTEVDDYVMVMATTLSHLAHDSLVQRRSKLDDGKIFLNLCGHLTNRRDCMKAWDLMEDGVGVHNKGDPLRSVGKTVECTAIRFVPKGRSHIIDSDGETLPFGPLQCSVLPKMARVMTAVPH